MRLFKKNSAPSKQKDDAAKSTQTETELDSSQSIETDSFIGGTVSGYKEPKFRANLHQDTKEFDVTPQASQPMPSAEAQDLPTPSAFTREKGADLNAMRLDVARISADIQSGEELYRRAQKRIDNLTDFVERAEVDFSLLNRLEPENRRLKANLRTLESEIDEKKRQISLLESEIHDQKARIAERNKAYDEAQNKLALAKTNLRDYERSLKTAQDNADRNALASDRAETALEVEKRENEILRQKLVESTVAHEEKQSGYLEARKMADSLMQDCEVFRNQAETAGQEVMELRNALDEAKKQNVHMKGELVQLHEDIRNFKTEYEFNLVAREDEIISMQSQIQTLQKQLDIKDEIVRNAARDVTELRKIRASQDLERERLEGLVDSQNYQLDETRAELRKTQQDVSDFDRRYKDVTAALSLAQARRNNDASAVAAQNAAQAPAPEIPETHAKQPFPKAPPMPPIADITEDVHTPAPAATSAEKPAEDLTEDEILSRVTDFKLGKRSKIS